MTEFMCKRCFDSHSSRSPGGRVSRLLPFLPSPHLLLPLATILTLFSLSAPLSSDLFLKCACVCGWVLHCHEMLLALHAKQPALHLWPTLAQSVYFLWEWGMQTCRWRREARCLHRNTFNCTTSHQHTHTNVCRSFIRTFLFVCIPRVTYSAGWHSDRCLSVCVWALQTHTKSAKKHTCLLKNDQSAACTCSHVCSTHSCVSEYNEANAGVEEVSLSLFSFSFVLKGNA